eukprot:COSAG05_NODE_3985_length_1738_cov_1.787675_2_plen_63_part_00
MAITTSPILLGLNSFRSIFVNLNFTGMSSAANSEECQVRSKNTAMQPNRQGVSHALPRVRPS